MQDYGYATDYNLPWLMRLQNKLISLFKGGKPVSTDELIQAARTSSGLTDLGDEGWREGLENLVDAFNQGPRPSFLTHVMFTGFCRQALVKRLEAVDCIKKNPEILDVPIEKPLFITGMPRTGTTLLQNLLAQDPNARPLLYWEQQRPVPPPEPETHASDPRIERAKAVLGQFFRLAPIYQAVHFMEAQSPEECNGLLDPSFCSILAATAYDVPGYYDWMLGHDMTAAYVFYKQQLQILAWKFPRKRHWVLKAPLHLNFLDALLEVFPDASIVITHRDPCTVLPSAASLSYLLRVIHGNKVNAGETGAGTLDRLARSMTRASGVREVSMSESFCDVGYAALMQNPVAVVNQIYERFGYAWTEELEKQLTDWYAEGKAQPRPRHRYDLARFALQEDTIAQRFANYHQDYGHLLKARGARA